MTTNEPAPIPAPPDPATPAPPRFSSGLCLAGISLALVVGAVLNVVADMSGASTNSKLAAALIGAIPGALFVLSSRIAKKNGLSEGLLIGGCIIGLIGGACGASLVGLSFR